MASEMNPMESIAKLVHDYGSFHCDATQAVGRVEFDADALGIDMVSITAIKYIQRARVL